MRQIWILVVAGLLAGGCAGSRSRARLDIYEGVKVDDLSGNKVSRGILDRRTLWLNARREVRRDLTRDYYLITELTPSPDFTLQSTGDSLVLLVDGLRYSFPATNTIAPLVIRPGIQTTAYRVPGEVLVKVANAEELKIRLKGTTMVLDETAPPSVSRNIQRWMLDRFQPDSPATSASANSTATSEAPASQREQRTQP